MTAREAPHSAFLVSAMADRRDGIQPLAYLTERAGSEEDAIGIALAAWRNSLPPQTDIRAVVAQGIDWRRLLPGEISRCVC